MFGRYCMVGVLGLVVLLAELGCTSSNGDPGGTDNSSTGGQTNGSGGVPRDDDQDATGADVVVVPRSVGGGVEEASAFAVEREALQLGLLLNRKREGVAHALRFLNDARKRFRRVLNIARRIENAPLADLPEGVEHAEFRVSTPNGEEICVRISSAPFAPREGDAPEGGAALDSDLGVAGEPVSLRIWINRQCTDSEEDYRRFYASILEARPEDVALADDDDSSAGAWRAGRGRAWIHPAALLDVDAQYRASAEWDHTDAADRWTVFHEHGRRASRGVLDAARYVVVRQETTDDEGNPMICKRVHATLEFSEHPLLSELDVRLGACFLAGEEGRAVGRLLAQGRFCRTREEECIEFSAGCMRPQDDDDQDQCGKHTGPQNLDLDDPVLIDEPLDQDAANLPDGSFGDLPPDPNTVEIVDLDG